MRRKHASAELDVVGYGVYRQAGHRRSAVNKLIAAKGTATGGSYRFVERGIRVTSALRYLLQVITPTALAPRPSL